MRLRQTDHEGRKKSADPELYPWALCRKYRRWPGSVGTAAMRPTPKPNRTLTNAGGATANTNRRVLAKAYRVGPRISTAAAAAPALSISAAACGIEAHSERTT